MTIECLAPTMGGRDKTSNLDEWRQIDLFAAQGDNSQLSAFWGNSYVVIMRANEIISRYEGANTSQQKKEEAAGQAHFIRAYNYFMLVRMYNKLPLYTNNEDASNDIALSEPEEIYSLIVEDLKLAEEFLPDNWAGDSKKEGVGYTSGAAKSLLAYVYLSMTGYPLNDESKYALAAGKAKEIIENENKWGYRIIENFGDLYSWEYNWYNKVNDEVVLAFCYDGNWKSVPASIPVEYGGHEIFMADINFYLNFPEGVRKEVTFVSDFPMEDGSTPDYTEIQAGHPFYFKYWDSDKFNPKKPWKPLKFKNARPQVALRHANNLLVYAEAQAMSSSPDASAYEAINRVRNRAGLPDLTPGLSKEAFRDSVVAERAWEFCGGEFAMDPWYDLVRLERVEASIDERHPDENPIVQKPTKEDYFMPYPDVDVNKNPNLTR